MAKRVLLLLLVCLMALPLLVACNNTAGTESVASQATSESGTTSEDVSEDPNIYPEIVDLDGREINVLQWGWGVGSSSINGYTGEIVYSDESEANYSRVDVAKKEVVDYIEATYNCTIGEGYRMTTGNIMEEVQQMVSTGTYNYDTVYASEKQALNMLSNNLLTDLKTVPTLHFENVWWDQNSVEDLSINGRLFAVCGDINTYDNLGTWCVLFNKKMKNDLGITDDFYQKASDGEWTMDYFMEICQGVSQDLDGDGLDEFDEPGVIDVIVSNPPYIESAVCDTLDPRVKDFEPRLALDGGETGLDFYDRYLGDALNLLKSGGAVFFEIGAGQGPEVERLMLEYGFDEIKIEKDYSGHDRYASAVLT
jgi:hypothetical protein